MTQPGEGAREEDRLTGHDCICAMGRVARAIADKNAIEMVCYMQMRNQCCLFKKVFRRLGRVWVHNFSPRCQAFSRAICKEKYVPTFSKG